MSSAEIRYLKINFDETLRRLEEYARLKAAIHHVRAIVLTGSLAKGNYAATSDADILVITEDLPDRFLERYGLFAEPRMPIDIEPRAYTTEEFISAARRGDRYALDSLEIGIPLFGEEFFNELRKSLGSLSRE